MPWIVAQSRMAFPSDLSASHQNHHKINLLALSREQFKRRRIGQIQAFCDWRACKLAQMGRKSGKQLWIFGDCLQPTMCQCQSIRQRRVIQRMAGTRRNASGHIRDTVMDYPIDFICRLGVSSCITGLEASTLIDCHIRTIAASQLAEVTQSMEIAGCLCAAHLIAPQPGIEFMRQLLKTC